jgi:hypothetical protein
MISEPVPEPLPPAPESDLEEQISAVVAETDEPMPQNVRKLLEIIDFQKQKIMDLLCMRDMLDDAHKQLEMLRQKNIDLENRIVSLVAASQSRRSSRSILPDFDEQSGARQLHQRAAAEQYRAWQQNGRVGKGTQDALAGGPGNRRRTAWESRWLLRLLPETSSPAGQAAGERRKARPCAGGAEEDGRAV